MHIYVNLRRLPRGRFVCFARWDNKPGTKAVFPARKSIWKEGELPIAWVHRPRGK